MINIQPDDQVISTAIGAAAVAAPAAYSVSEEMEKKPTVSPPDPINYHDVKKAIRSFKTALQNVASSLSSKNRPLIIAIDELDRCRPSYAVELLEIVKHFFSVENIVFVLAIDKPQLSHAIKAIYGNEFDSTGYLRRFIDLDFRLPDPDRTKFVDELLEITNINNFIKNHNISTWGSFDSAKNSLRAFLVPTTISLRQIQQSISRLSIILNSFSTSDPIPYEPIAFMMTLKTLAPIAYYAFINLDMTDLEVSNHIFKLPGMNTVKPTSYGTTIDTFLILAQYELKMTKTTPPAQELSELHAHFDAQSMSYEATETFEIHHAKNVKNRLNELESVLKKAQRNQPVGFSMAVQRIEMFSS